MPDHSVEHQPGSPSQGNTGLGQKGRVRQTGEDGMKLSLFKDGTILMCRNEYEKEKETNRRL